LTNYRLRIPKNEMSEWKHCFTCGLPLELRPDLEPDEEGQEVWGCSARDFHLLIWTTSDDTAEPEFI
jgi:hypothetical protein